MLFHLALTFGLREDPVAAMTEAVRKVESVGRDHGVRFPMQGTIAVSDGATLWAFRYSTERKSRTLFVSAEADAVHALYPENENLRRLRDEDRIVVSEPLADLEGVWHEIPESTVLIVQSGPDEQRPFRPHYDGAVTNGAPVGSPSTS